MVPNAMFSADGMKCDDNSEVIMAAAGCLSYMLIGSTFSISRFSMDMPSLISMPKSRILARARRWLLLAVIIVVAGSTHAQSVDGIRWIAPPVNGNALKKMVFVSPDTGWIVGTQGTILRSTDGGDHWEQVASGTRNDLNGIAFASDQSGWIVGDNGTLLVTVTGGEAWEQRDLQLEDKLNDVAFLSENVGLIVGDFGVMLRTSDAGETWVTFRAGDAVDRTHLVLNSRHDGLMCNRDGSVSVLSRFGQIRKTGKEFDGEILSAVCSRKGDLFLVLDAKGECVRTRDGQEWHAIGLPVADDGTVLVPVCAAPFDERRIVVADSKGNLYYTLNAGATWASRRSALPGLSSTSLTIRDDSTAFAAGLDGSIVKIRLPAFTVQAVNAFQPVRMRKLLFLDEGEGMAISDQGFLMGSRDGGKTWTHAVESGRLGAVGIRSVVQSGEQTVHVLTDVALVRSSDGGRTWRECRVVDKTTPSELGATASGDAWFGGKGYLVIASGAGGRDRAFLSPTLRDHPLDTAGMKMDVEWSLSCEEEIRTFLRLSSRRWIITTSDGKFHYTTNGGSVWTVANRTKFVPDFVVPLAEGTVIWLTRGGEVRLGSAMGETAPVSAGQQAYKAAMQFADTSAKTVDIRNGELGVLPAARLVAPIGGVSVSAGGIVAIACGRGIALRSTDEGVHWQGFTLPTDEDLTGIQFVDAFDGWAYTKSGVVWHSVDGGMRWEMSRRIAAASVITFVTPHKGWLATSQGSLMVTTNNGDSWETVPIGVTSLVRDMCTDVGGIVWLGLPRGLMKISAAAPEGRQILPIPRGGDIRIMGAAADSSLVFLTDGGSVGVLGASDTMCTMIPLPVPVSSAAAVGGPDRRRPFVITSGPTHYRWEPAVQKWRPFTIDVPAKLNALVFTDPNTGCVAGDLGYISVTRDGGMTWNQIPRTTFSGLTALAYSPLRGVVWAAGEGGSVFVSDAQCSLWLRIHLPSVEAWAGLQFLPPDLLYVYSGRGKIVQLHTSEVLTEDQ
jgi:photosystem II stability/assembly factor-like uncharacterized protein